ncbi:PIH1 domain-containing protein 2 [Boothiomyces sp. JEL0866]|nr:PIH1 domain-containing protein 2 [Boothiomyces sp. JEL0866]
MNQQTIEQLWSSLDDMARRDPKEYKKYIESLKKQADIDSRAIKPGYYIKAESSNKSKHILNICHSKAVEDSPDNYNIPTLMSEQRTYRENPGNQELIKETYFVYDAVFHPNVYNKKHIEKDVRDLAVSCVLELFNVRLLPSTFQIVEEEYFGPYGWDDSKGKALTTDELKNKTENHLSLGEIEEMLKGKNVNLPTAQISADQQDKMDEFKLKLPRENNPPSKPLIQEVKEAKKWIIPDFSTKSTDECMEVIVFLPEIESSKEIEYTRLEPGKFQIKAGEKYLFQHTIPESFDCENMNGKFVLAKKKLKMKFFKASVAA